MTIHQTSDTSIPNASPANQSACLAFCQLAILSIFLLCTFAFCNTATAQQDFDSDLREAFDDLPAITDPGKAIQLTIKAKADDVLKYRMESSSKIDMMGLIIPRSDNYLVEYKINSNDKYGFEFTSQITEMVAKMETRNGNFSVDSVNPENERTDPPFIPLLKLWKELQASELTCKCSKQGEILDFQVPERIVEAVADNPFGFSANDLMSFFVIGLAGSGRRSFRGGRMGHTARRSPVRGGRFQTDWKTAGSRRRGRSADGCHRNRLRSRNGKRGRPDHRS